MRKGGIPNFSVLQVEALKFGFKLLGPWLGSTQAVASSDSLLLFRALVPPSALASRGRSKGGGPAMFGGSRPRFWAESVLSSVLDATSTTRTA